MEDQERVLNIIKEYHDYLQELKANEPYHVNVLDNVRILENDHTRILLNILRYSQGERYLILESFLKAIGNVCDDNPFENLPQIQPSIEFNRENIDGLIEYPQQLGVIIENKINNAVDQQNQIERYVKTVIEHGIPSEQVYVLYLTLDGSKEVTDYSYTEIANELLEDGLHFIPIDYKHHVLPWLQDSLIPLIKNYEKEKLLLSTIELYTDYLKGRFNLRLYQQQISNKMNEFLIKHMNIDGDDKALPEKIKIVNEYIQSISNVQDTLSEIREQLEQKAFDSFDRISKEYWAEKNVEITINNQARNGYYQLNVAAWSIVNYLHMEFMIFSDAILEPHQKLIVEIHLEGDHALLKEELEKFIRPLNSDYDEKVLYHEEYNIDDLSGEFSHDKPFVCLSYDSQKRILHKIYDDIQSTFSSIDNVINHIPTINVDELHNYYQQSIKPNSFIQKVWTYGSSRYLVLDEKSERRDDIAIDVDCRIFEKTVVSIFLRGGDIKQYLNEMEVIKLNEMFSIVYDNNWHRYACVIALSENTNTNLVMLIDNLLNFLREK